MQKPDNHSHKQTWKLLITEIKNKYFFSPILFKIDVRPKEYLNYYHVLEEDLIILNILSFEDS